jgi:hypothetical protein
MHLPIGETLEQIRELKTPVARTSHFGNLGSHNWGWLALGGNTELLQWEHSLYGIDDIYVPWVVLGDRGVVEASYGPSGAPRPEEVGRHVSEAFRRVDHKYQRHLNYGIFAEHGGGDLMARHYRLSGRLSRQLNGSSTALVVTELLRIEEALSRLIRDLSRRQALHLLFNRWVRVSRKGYVVMLKLRNIEHLGPTDLALYTKDGITIFRGSIDDLIELFVQGLRGVVSRFETGGFPPFRHYPWIIGYSTYLLRALEERQNDPGQESFWHAGASASQFYIHEEGVASYLDDFRAELVQLGYLPPGFQIRLIPTFSAQLFATCEESLAVLASLLDFWRALLSRQAETARLYLDLLASRPDPRPVVEEFCRALGAPALAELARRVEEFNAIGPHQLPIANLTHPSHPTYNKYGIAQQNLLAETPLFPPALLAMTWREAELLVKTLAQVVIDRQG